MKKRLADWINSEEGQRAMKEACERANAATDYLKKARKIDWWRLHEPFTI